MANKFSFLNPISLSRFSPSLRPFFFFLLTTLALLTSFSLIFYISSTSTLFWSPQSPKRVDISARSSSVITPAIKSAVSVRLNNGSGFGLLGFRDDNREGRVYSGPNDMKNIEVWNGTGNSWASYHDEDIFMEDYKEMNRSFKIYVYPHTKDDPFANVLLPVEYEPGGNYASESYFKKVLTKSHFVTKDPTAADLFFLPFSIASMRHDRRIGVKGIQDFIRNYIFNVSMNYPFWNRTGGADHFYVACHSIGKTAMEKAYHVKFNSIQVVCSSNYFVPGYVPHKDVSLPQIWPRHDDFVDFASWERKQFSFFAGVTNSPVRKSLLEAWRNDSEIIVHDGRLNTPYADALLGSKFCFHVKGYEVNTARIADSLYYGCVPVIIANYYDLPFADVLNWKSFSVIVINEDIESLKKILKSISSDEYISLRNNVLNVRKHFQWHLSPVDYDAFHMTLYELWVRRSSLRVLI